MKPATRAAVLILAATGGGVGATARAATAGAVTANAPRIAWVAGSSSSSSHVWLANADGTHRHRLGTGTQPLLSPNGSLVGASTGSFHGAALTVFSASGSGPRRFFRAANATAVAQAWSPDSRYLAVVLSGTDPFSVAGSRLAVIDTSTSRVRVLANGVIYGASFAPDSPDRLAYAVAATTALSARVNIHVVGADGSHRMRLTRDGRSLNPVWGPQAIAFDRERLRSLAAPAYQIWLMRSDGTRRRRITDLRVGALFDGLVPLGFSGDGMRLLAEYEGQDTSQAWALTVATHRLRRLEIDGGSVAGAAISHTGAALLVDRGGFLNPPDVGIVESIGFTGARARVLVAHGSDPSWNL
jgi:Tol biopolymer transport system component